jgi:hypothetical protein
MPQDY